MLANQQQPNLVNREQMLEQLSGRLHYEAGSTNVEVSGDPTEWSQADLDWLDSIGVCLEDWRGNATSEIVVQQLTDQRPLEQREQGPIVRGLLSFIDGWLNTMTGGR